MGREPNWINRHQLDPDAFYEQGNEYARRFFLLMRKLPPGNRQYVDIEGYKEEIDDLDVVRDYLLEKVLSREDYMVARWSVLSCSAERRLVYVQRTAYGTEAGPFYGPYGPYATNAYLLMKQPETWDPYLTFVTLRTAHPAVDLGAMHSAPAHLKRYRPERI